MDKKWWIIVKTRNKIELHGPYLNLVEATIKSRAYIDNVEVTSFIVLNQDQLVTLLELITDTLVD